ncbi:MULTISPECIES: XdhC family protein [Streptomyces]|uniref:Xanthine dehydrogenase accessory factor n=1 Tax=Streptomyces stelliscabiei TaxID=146820 RepID=A0A8I0TPR1_9ACTN|nr:MULTISPECIES: XdhC/CoxI family protein [Streptomyces]KND46419.1 XshC-Cox1-family protein [Streptomyces stelliscabiei]MBE1595131.1 xanthine dehydrogenase accessory factor [Streptomyces stelliscabiei]MDX2516097.1 XdhC family protein [Streptomyces stelliscabiei]MDX2553069.1 XdhC family protein [Streptomyces stelliscabiei]MDX2612057.1 XdhC family protein [Streptomyces stelliscabiei]
MLDAATELSTWAEEGRDFAVATVVAVSGSAPRGPGAALAVDSRGTAVGSVSGGCVEGEVYELCRQALADGGTVLRRFGYSDEDAFAVGLTCGGVIDILVTPVTAGSPVRAVLRAALSAAARGERTALARVVRGPAELLGQALLVRADGAGDRAYDGAAEGGLGGHPELDRTAAAEARAMLDGGRSGTVELSADGSHCPGGLTLLVETRVPPPRMIVFGAIDFAAALVRAGKFLGHHVTVCDARPVFATRARFPEADDIVVDWPHRYLRRTATDRRTVLCVLTHDAKFDIPLLTAALRMPVAFVGAMGSRRTHADRERRLREAGLTERELARLRSPIGLDLGARTPEETALSIAAEIVAARRGGTGVPLTGSGTPIHHEAAERGDVAAA